ncbi:pyridoxal phosphate-dependent transferase [Pyronema omphalodes]|nr:pyridoxal phosphate-dependent transferase [Pyronema omphalodes]
MSSQAAHATLLIPGPIEFHDDVLNSMAHHSESHVGAAFVNVFGETLTMLRKLFIATAPTDQPLVVSGSGTLGWDFVAANLIKPGEDALVLHTGYFADSFADCISTYGGVPTQLKAPVGSRPSIAEIKAALQEKNYKVITITHVDTSTGVLSDIQAIAAAVKEVSPSTLVVVDGVCSVGCEEIQFTNWGIDVVLTASQKAIGVPAGLCIMMMSGRAMDAFNNRGVAPGSYFASFKNWIPIMQNYEAKKPSYFATPSPQLIRALHTSLSQYTNDMEGRFKQHKKVSVEVVKARIEAMGLKQLASDPEARANGMTAIYLPEGITAAQLLPKLLAKGVIFAGGLHRECAPKYFRFGHMGVSVTDAGLGHIEKALNALEESIKECRN